MRNSYFRQMWLFLLMFAVSLGILFLLSSFEAHRYLLMAASTVSIFLFSGSIVSLCLGLCDGFSMNGWSVDSFERRIYCVYLMSVSFFVGLLSYSAWYRVEVVFNEWLYSVSRLCLFLIFMFSVIIGYCVLIYFVFILVTPLFFRCFRGRGFRLTSAYKDDVDLLPQRATKKSAGYDLKAAETVTIVPNDTVLVPTGVKAYMQDNEVLYLYDRSSNPKKRGIVLANSVGVIDADYYDNPSNEGLIYAQFKNIWNEPVTINKGDRIMQGVFSRYLTVDDDRPLNGERKGGIGSTDN